MPLSPDDPWLVQASSFFDRLVDAVPARHYLHLDEGRQPLRFAKKADRERLRAEFKAQHKAAKRAKLDPAQAKTTLQLQRELALQADAARRSSSAALAAAPPPPAAAAAEAAPGGGEPAGQQQPQQQQQQGGDAHRPPGLAPGREELRARLQQKLEALRKQRKADESQASEQQAKTWRDKALAKSRTKVQKKALQTSLKPAAAAAPAAAAGTPAAAARAGGGGVASPGKRSAEERDLSLTFTKLDFGAAGEGKGRKRRKLSKPALLAEAEAKAALAGSAEGQERLQKEAWRAAMQRSAGSKVLDDAKLLKKSIKKEAKVKSKKAQAWAQRQGAQVEAQQAKQQRRQENIGTRVAAKAEKKKARRERKLLRAGFEGRKAGYIETPKKGG